MDYGQSDTSGTDDDLPPPHMNRMPRAGDRAVANGRTPVGRLSYAQADTDMESHIHRMEQEAYSAVLRAFIAQSDAFTWDKEELISDLRQELNVTDAEHRILLGKVKRDDVLTRIREYRDGASNQQRLISGAAPSAVKSLDPTVSASCKKPKTMKGMVSLRQSLIPSDVHTASGALTSSAARKGGTIGAVGGRKSKGMHSSDVRWACDGPSEGNHEEAGHSEKIMTDHGGFNMASARVKTFQKSQSAKGYASFQNGACKKKPENIELRQTDKLIKEVERVCRGDHPDPSAVESAKMILKEHEQSLVEAIARLGDLSDEDEDQMPHSFRTYSNQERMWRNRDGDGNGNGGDNREDIARGRRGGQNREPMVAEGCVAYDDDYADEDD